MLIREMTVNDIERVVELEESLFTSAWSKADFRYEIVDNIFSHNFVLEEDEKIVGYVGLWITYEQSQITTIGVDPDYQRHGFGRLLMNEMIELAVSSGCEVMSLEVRVSNYKAIALYESLGFENQAMRKNYYQDNNEDAYLMVKRLEEVK